MNLSRRLRIGRKTSKILIILSSFIMIVTVVFSLLSLPEIDVSAAQADITFSSRSYNLNVEGDISPSFCYRYPVVNTGLVNFSSGDTYDFSIIYSVIPGNRYTFRVFSPSSSSYLNRFRIGAYSRYPSNGVQGSVLVNGVTSFTQVGNYKYYDFTCPDDVSYILVFLYTDAPSQKYIQDLIETLRPYLFSSFINNSSFSFTKDIDHWTDAVNFYLSASGGLLSTYLYGGDYSFQISYRISGSSGSYTVWKSDLKSGTFISAPPLDDDLDYQVEAYASGSRQYSIKSFLIDSSPPDQPSIVIPDVSDSSFIPPDVSLSVLPSPDVSIDSPVVFGEMVKSGFLAFPPEFLAFFPIALILGFIAWWLHK